MPQEITARWLSCLYPIHVQRWTRPAAHCMCVLRWCQTTIIYYYVCVNNALTSVFGVSAFRQQHRCTHICTGLHVSDACDTLCCRIEFVLVDSKCHHRGCSTSACGSHKDLYSTRISSTFRMYEEQRNRLDSGLVLSPKFLTILPAVYLMFNRILTGAKIWRKFENKTLRKIEKLKNCLHDNR